MPHIDGQLGAYGAYGRPQRRVRVVQGGAPAGTASGGLAVDAAPAAGRQPQAGAAGKEAEQLQPPRLVAGCLGLVAAVGAVTTATSGRRPVHNAQRHEEWELVRVLRQEEVLRRTCWAWSAATVGLLEAEGAVEGVGVGEKRGGGGIQRRV